MALHRDLTGDDAIHQSAYIQSSDPGAVGAKKLWIDTTSGYVLKKRKDDDSGWDTLGTLSSGVTVTDGDKGDIVVASSGTSWTFDTGVVTAAAKTVLDDATTGDMLTTLGAQPADAELTAIAGLTSAADKGIQFTGSGTAATYDLTTAGKALLDDADAAAQRTTLGVYAGKKIFDSTVVGSDAATIDTGAAAIPSGYAMLEIILIGRSDEAVVAATAGIQFNADATAANYPRQYHGATNTTQAAGDDAAVKGISAPIPGTSADANIAGITRVLVPAYDQTTFYKVCDSTCGQSSSTASQGAVYQIVTNWKNTAAITQVTADAAAITAGKKFKVGSRMIIYGR